MEGSELEKDFFLRWSWFVHVSKMIVGKKIEKKVGRRRGDPGHW